MDLEGPVKFNSMLTFGQRTFQWRRDPAFPSTPNNSLEPMISLGSMVSSDPLFSSDPMNSFEPMVSLDPIVRHRTGSNGNLVSLNSMVSVDLLDFLDQMVQFAQ